MIKVIYILVLALAGYKIFKELTKIAPTKGVMVNEGTLDVFFKFCSSSQKILSESKGPDKLYAKGFIYGLYSAANILLGTDFKQGISTKENEEDNKDVKSGPKVSH